MPLSEQSRMWPKEGRHILAQYTDDAVLVYQAYPRAIGEYAAEHGRFLGAPGWSSTRMTWIKPGFLWMCYRSEWGTARNQEVVLGVWLRRSAFDRILASAILSTHPSGQGTTEDEAFNSKVSRARSEGTLVRCQWDPDHSPSGAKHPARRAIQLGLKGVRSYEDGSDIVAIWNLSRFVEEQRQNIGSDGALMTPVEREYHVPQAVAAQLRMTDATAAI